jgi:hypothetical protein
LCLIWCLVFWLSLSAEHGADDVGLLLMFPFF